MLPAAGTVDLKSWLYADSHSTLLVFLSLLISLSYFTCFLPSISALSLALPSVHHSHPSSVLGFTANGVWVEHNLIFFSFRGWYLALNPSWLSQLSECKVSFTNFRWTKSHYSLSNKRVPPVDQSETFFLTSTSSNEFLFFSWHSSLYRVFRFWQVFFHPSSSFCSCGMDSIFDQYSVFCPTGYIQFDYIFPRHIQ